MPTGIKKVVAIHQPETLPWLGFFDKLRQCDLFILLDHVSFEKNYYQNRNRIRTAGQTGWSWLTVPVRTKGRFGQPLCDVEIQPNAPWQRKHLGTMEAAYRNAAAFEANWKVFKNLYETSWKRLVDFNIAMIEWMASRLGLDTPMVRSSQLQPNGRRSELLLGLAQQSDATEYLSGISGRDYLDQALFETAGIHVRFQEFRHPVYPQTLQPFVPTLSGMDLIFNCGLSARDILLDKTAQRLTTVWS